MGKYTVERSKHRVSAIGFISGKIEEIMETAYLGVIQSNYTPEVVTIDDRGTPIIGDDLTGTLTVTVTEIVAGIDGYKKVSVVLNWTEKAWGGSNNLSESATTYVVQE